MFPALEHLINLVNSLEFNFTAAASQADSALR